MTTISCTNKEFRFLAKEFFDNVGDLEFDQIESAIKCISLAFLGVDRNDLQNIKYPPETIFKLAHKAYIDALTVIQNEWWQE